MNKIAILICVAVLSAIPNLGLCYGIKTHEDLTEAAANASALGTSDLLARIGIRGPVDGEAGIAKTFPDSKGTPKTVLKLIRNGAGFEDDPAINVRNHFYNPSNGAPLGAGIVYLGCTSPDWALEDGFNYPSGQIDNILCGNQKFSYADARQYFYDALTKFTEPDRDKNFGLAFESLGHIVHHLQDMAQPQHVRSDQHLELPTELEIGLCTFIFDLRACLAYLAIRNPSAYEGYTDRVRGSPQFLGWLSAATPVYGEGITPKFFKPRDFWLGANGIATFTNRNMLSAGTNFNNFGVNLLPGYDPAGDLVVDIKTLVPGTTLHGLVSFYATKASNPELGDIANPLASSSSLFDWDLTKLEGNPRSPKRVFSLNRINYDIAHTFLIPRAVGYSAGLINYFFRGKIDLVPDPANTGKHIIKNLGPEDMTGTFTLYYDAVDGSRYPVAGDAPDKTWENLVIPKNSQVDKLSFTSPTNPAPQTPDEYMLVFNGDMGEEKAIPGTTVGAVAAKKVGDEADFYIAPSDRESYGRLGRFSAAGSFLDQGHIRNYGGFIESFMAYGQDIFHIENPYDRKLPSYATRNGVPFQAQVTSLNDIAGNGKEIFVVASDGYVNPVVSVYDFEGRFLRSFSILPQYAIQGGFVQLVANDSYLVASANFTMVIYDTAGSSRLTLDLGQNIYESILAVSRDRIYRANYRESVVQIYDFNGAPKGSVSVSGIAKITCMDATESKLYVVTSDSVGFPPYGGRIHIFSRNAATDAYLLLREISIPYGLDSWQHACSVDRASSRTQK